MYIVFLKNNEIRKENHLTTLVEGTHFVEGDTQDMQKAIASIKSEFGAEYPDLHYVEMGYNEYFNFLEN